MNKKTSTILFLLGFLFLLNAIFGRYLVLPGYLENLEQGNTGLESVSRSVSGWKIARYLLWAYSFKLGIYLVMLGAAFKAQMPASRKWALAIGGFVYIGFAYVPLPAPESIVFGLAGGSMTLLMIFIFFSWGHQRPQLPDHQQTAGDYRMAGYFFFAMATYTLCPLLGVKTFALSPEKMIAYGLQGEAASFTFHILVELVLGWVFIGLSLRNELAVQQETAWLPVQAPLGSEA